VKVDSKVFDPLQDENVVFSAPSIRAQYHVQCSAFNQNKGETSVGLSHSACFDRVSSCHEDEKNAVVRVAYPARAHPPLECGRTGGVEAILHCTLRLPDERRGDRFLAAEVAPLCLAA
jgi:hypothetical protein